MPTTNIIQDGDFLDPIGTGLNSTPWSDWTNAGITRSAAPAGIPGDYASLPVGADLFQRFSALAPGAYTLSFLVENPSPWAANLVPAVSQAFGAVQGGIATLFNAGTAEELHLPASMTSFVRETLNFTITQNEAFIPNEFTFSNSYDAPVGPIADSVNPPGTIINVADVSITSAPPDVPIPAPDRTNAQVGGPAARGNVLTNDTDPVASDTLTVTAIKNAGGQAGVVGQPITDAYGTLTLNADGTYTYQASSSAVLPASGVVQDVFTYTEDNGHGGTATSTLTVVVTGSGTTYLGGSSGTTITAPNGKSPVLDGGAGGDIVSAHNGAATLIGGPGDTLSGGNGADTFVFIDPAL